MLREGGEIRFLAEMSGEEGNELPQVARIGLAGERRGLPLRGQAAEPDAGFSREVGRGLREYEVRLRGSIHGAHPRASC